MDAEALSCGGEPLRSQHELRALASMVVASLPFPPLPVMVLQGADGADGLASSFDLLQTAVVNWHLGMRPAGQEAEAIARSKLATLARLQQDMAALYVETDWKNLTDDWGAVRRAYVIYCAAFRTYLLDHYGTGTRDLRFYPAEAVAADSVLVQQGTSHWRASRLLAGEGCGGEGGGAGGGAGGGELASAARRAAGARFSSYRQMVRAYALDLATLS